MGHQLELMLIKPLDRITLLHGRQGAPDRALGAFDEVKAKYPAIVELSGGVAIIKRIDRARAKVQVTL